MRVIAGTARGRALKGPPKPKASGKPGAGRGIRPTSDLVREVIFDMLDALGADYDRVLDLYAGAGGLGIEALSRGEGTADFVETDPAAAAVIVENLRSTGFAPRGRLHRFDAKQSVSRLQGVYTLVLSDPPYYDEAAGGAAGAFEAARRVAESNLVDERTVVVIEHHRRSSPPDVLGQLPLYRSRRHGDTVVSIYAQEEAE